MAPRSAEQFEEMREQSRRQILNAALELFATSGYHTTSVEAVARRAKVSKGLIYNYFESKEQLLEAIIMGTMAHIAEEMVPLAQEPDPRVRVRTFVDSMFAMVKESGRFWSLYFSLLLQPSIPDELRLRFVGFMKETLGMFTQAFEHLGSRHAYAQAWMFGAMLDGLTMYYIFAPEECPLDEIKARIYALFLGEEER